MVAAKSVLIVDPSDETRDVLRCALEHRGHRTLGARRVEEGLALAESCRPDCIVLDLEIEPQGRGEDHVAAGFAARSASQPLVLLGTLRSSRQTPTRAEGAATEFVAKPYHYAPLIRKIEALLASQP